MSGVAEATGVWSLFAARAAATPDCDLAYDEFGRSITVGALFAQAEAMAAGFHADGVRAGEVISWQLTNRFETMACVLALSRLGAVQNPLVTMLRASDLVFICGQAGSSRLLVPRTYRGFDHEAMAKAVAEDLPGLRVHVADDGWPTGDPKDLPPLQESAGEVRWLMYTSGTTSAPKGARHTDRAVLAAADTFGAALQVGEFDRVASLAPIGHVAGLAHICNALRTGAALIISEVFDPVATTQLLADHGVTLVGSGLPFIRVYRERQRELPAGTRLFPAARAFLCGGSPRPAALHAEVKRELGSRGVVSGYGLTECPHLCWGHIDDTDAQHAQTEGTPAPGGSVRIVGPDGATMPAGEIGEIRLHGPQLMLGYVDASLDTAAFDEHGFLRTGDLGFLGDDGYLTVTGRAKDVIIRNMENISAREVEEAVALHPAVADVTVIGLPSAVTGELACAVIVVVPGAEPPTLAGLATHLHATGLNIRKHPERLEFLDELPRNAMGKVQKPQLVSRFIAGAPEEVSP